MWRFFLQKPLFYLPLQVLEGSACEHIFKLQLRFLVCSALQAHSALGHFLGRRSHRQRGSEHHDGILYMNPSYFNVPDDYSHNHPRALKSSNMKQQICQTSGLSCGLRAARDHHLSVGVQEADSDVSNGAPASVALQDEVPWISFSLCSRRPDLRHNRHLFT